MTTVGFYLSCEEYGPRELVEQARAAEQAGFDSLWISDHFHPWNDAQGQSPFVWSVIGAIAEATSLPVTTAVTCPIMRTHPAIVAQAAATSALLLDGRFRLGVGTGEDLNEHIVGRRWPAADVRLEMLDEAVTLIRDLWSGDVVSREGRYFTTDRARIYSLPPVPPKILVSGFGPKAVDLAARIGDGYVQTTPDPSLLERFRAGSSGGPAIIGLKACWAVDEETAVEIAHRLWRTSGLPGELSQVLPTPQHFEQAAELVTPEQTRQSMPCGPDPEPVIEQMIEAAETGFDEVYVASVGPHWREMITHLQPHLDRVRRSGSEDPALRS